MEQRATGTFTVKMVPETDDGAAAGAALGRLALNKEFSGDLVGTGAGTMLTAMSGKTGSAGYVAIERVTGTLHGKHGSFVLQHTGVMTRGAPSLAITIVPDSGTDALTGIAGSFAIDTSGGGHAYVLTYTLPASP